MLRADGTPTYMLSVVDDHDMGVTHAIRGDDHLTNAFRQTQIFRAMDWEPPLYAHIPLIHGPDGEIVQKAWRAWHRSISGHGISARSGVKLSLPSWLSHETMSFSRWIRQFRGSILRISIRVLHGLI